MSSTRSKKKSEAERLKEFGLVMGFALTLVTAYLFWKSSSWAVLSSCIAAVFVLLGVFCPLVLGPFEKRWMQLAEKMSVVVTWIIVTLTFYLVMAPLGFVMRLFGADLLHLKIDKDAQSYWTPVEEDGPSSRPFLPY